MEPPVNTSCAEFSQENPFFSVVVLCYRSGESVIPFVHRLHHMLSLCNFPWEIVLVGNYVEGLEDDTPRVVKDLEIKLTNVRSLTRPKQGMMGWDMRMGLDMAKGKYLAVIDGDGQFPLESLIACLAKIEGEGLDLVKTYRVRREDGLYRRTISYAFNRLFQFLFKMNIRDVNSKPKVLLRSQYERMHLHSNDWFVDTEIMLQAQEAELRIGEIPIHFYAISERASFVKPAAIYEFLRNLIQYRRYRKKIGPSPTSKRPNTKEIA